MAAATASPPSLFSRVRLATPSDVPHLHKLFTQMAATDHIAATESSLSSSLFTSDPFISFTIFLLELSSTPFPTSSTNPFYKPTCHVLNLDRPIQDPDKEAFRSDGHDDDVVVAGFVLFFPSFPTFIGKSGFRVQDLFVRECYRERGLELERMLLSCVAKQALTMGYERVDLIALSWDEKGIKFYDDMGFKLTEPYRVVELTGEPLEAFRSTV